MTIPTEADFVIAGGGSAGCVLAARLSENPRHKVVLLEAGGSSDNLLVKMPVGTYLMLSKPKTDWMYETEPDPSLLNRQVTWMAGKMLGGGSSINGMVYIRGARSDYDSWANDLGCDGWSWDEVQRYFMKSEGFGGEAGPTHSTEGPLGVSARPKYHPLAQKFIDACHERGLRKVDDYCSGDIDGAFTNLVTQRKGQRSSAARAFLETAMKRQNLQVITEALVDKVVIENGRAIGVQFIKDGEKHIVRARREVIVSASTMQSPAILMRSGIGPADALRELGIDVAVDAPEVGRNLQEHASVNTSYFVDIPTYNNMVTAGKMPWNILNYFLFGRGALTITPVEAMAYLRSQPGLENPDIKLQFGALAFDAENPGPHKRPGIIVYANVAKPRSRGEIRLRSVDPAEKPVIDHRLLGDPEDVAALIRGLKEVDEIFNAPALAGHLRGRLHPEVKPQTDEEWEQHIRSTAGIGFHPVGTCRMGGDPASVVDPQLRVRGITGLRVADASIMPVMPAANTNAPAIMVGEKAADMILQDAK
ncbi:GMC family oxidoreductase [Zhongshania sp.]|uniref:GMC family oxidoreductase n=1 Tax=Zhongshania sp. TaxID=1971902 RepID=UPI0035682B9B